MKNNYYIHRDKFVQNQKGVFTYHVKREYLRVAGSGRYTWVSDPWEATGLKQCECCNIMANLTRYIRPDYRYDFVCKTEED